MFNQKSLLVIFIDRLGIQLYGTGMTSMVTLQIPENIIKDLEVISKDALYTLIKQWVKQYGLSGFQIIFIFSESVYMEKQFITSDQTQIETDILKFFDMVPYESIWSKVYPMKNGKRAVAISKTFYEGIRQGFLLQGIPTKTVIPAFALGQYDKKRAMDSVLYSYVLDNIEQLSKFSIADVQELNNTTSNLPLTPSSDPSKKKSSLPLLLSVFGFLLLVLGIIVYLQYR